MSNPKNILEHTHILDLNYDGPYCKICDKQFNGDEVTITVNTKETEEQQWGIILERHAIKPFLDRVIVLKDPEESKLNCSKCKGVGHLGVKCSECGGNGRFRGKDTTDDRCTTCYFCTDKSYSGNLAAWVDLRGHEPCDLCGGKKTSSIARPDDQKDKKTLTGKVIAVGEDTKFVKQNMRVMFTNYTGVDFLIDGVKLMYCSEKDLVGQYKQLKKDTFNESIQEKTHEELAELGVDSGIKAQ